MDSDLDDVRRREVAMKEFFHEGHTPVAAVLVLTKDTTAVTVVAASYELKAPTCMHISPHTTQS
jgi:tRNA(Arg) A34 adenosine deaminase TadA